MSVPPTFGQELRPIEVVLRNQRPMLSRAYLIAYPNDTALVEENRDEALWLSDYAPYLDSIEEVMQPISDLYYPIIIDAHKRIEWMDGTYRREDHTVGAFFSLSIYWKDMLLEILAEGSVGILVSTSGDLVVKKEQHVSTQSLIPELLSH
jgi:hypothetical protein